MHKENIVRVITIRAKTIRTLNNLNIIKTPRNYQYEIY